MATLLLHVAQAGQQSDELRESSPTSITLPAHPDGSPNVFADEGVNAKCREIGCMSRRNEERAIVDLLSEVSRDDPNLEGFSE